MTLLFVLVQPRTNGQTRLYVVIFQGKRSANLVYTHTHNTGFSSILETRPNATGGEERKGLFARCAIFIYTPVVADGSPEAYIVVGPVCLFVCFSADSVA